MVLVGLRILGSIIVHIYTIHVIWLFVSRRAKIRNVKLLVGCAY